MTINDPDLLDPGDLATVRVIEAIVNHYYALVRPDRVPFDRLSVTMDLTVASNLGHVDLDRLLDAAPSDLAHDVGGIVRHLDRETGGLRGGFVPRCR